MTLEELLAMHPPPQAKEGETVEVYVNNHRALLNAEMISELLFDTRMQERKLVAEMCALIADRWPHRKGYTIADEIRRSFELPEPEHRPIRDWAKRLAERQG